MRLEKINAKGIHNLYRHPKTEVIYFRKYSKGREITRSTRTRDLKIAKTRAEGIFEEAFGPKPFTAQGKTSLELFDTWVQTKKTLNRRANTITSILASRNYFEKYFEFMKPEQIRSEWWLQTYIPEIRAKTHLDRKFFNDRKWLKAFLGYLHKNGVIHEIPFLENPDPAPAPGKVYSDEEIGLLLNFVQSEDLYLAILMASTMGMRRLEIFGLRCDRIDAKAKVIRLRREDTKTKKARSFFVSDISWPTIKERLESGSPWVFSRKGDLDKPVHKDGFMTAWRNLKKICGIDGRFHDLRHTFLTKAFKAPGSNAALICHYAGLSLEVAEKTYLHFNENDTKQVASLVLYGEINSGTVR